MTLDSEFQAALADQNAGRLAQAEQAYRAILDQGDHLATLHNLGVLLEKSGRFGEAEGVYRRATEAAPDNPAPWRALANYHHIARQYADAETDYRRLLTLGDDDDEIAATLGHVLLGDGRYPEGWAFNERRQPRRMMLGQGLSFPEWRGEPLAGKRLFVWREQGFGDQIMMARFLPRLGAGQIIYAGPPALERLFEPLGLTYVPYVQGQFAVPSADHWILPQSLPARLGITAQTVPGAPYLTGHPAPSAGRIGVIWRGEAANPNNRYRSIPAAQAAPLLALPGAISLEPADTGARDFQATADIIAGLDLVITVDTAVAHLAGALGARVWVLLASRANDWQWPRTETTPWYPSARLFAQATPGDWAPVIAAVCDEVRREGLGA